MDAARLVVAKMMDASLMRVIRTSTAVRANHQSEWQVALRACGRVFEFCPIDSFIGGRLCRLLLRKRDFFPQGWLTKAGIVAVVEGHRIMRVVE